MKAFLKGVAICVALVACSTVSQAQVNDPLRPNQTEGFGAGHLLDFTYTQSFVCVDQNNSDLDFDHKRARSDSNEQQIPICQAGNDPTINPPGTVGAASTTTDPLYVLIPMFSTDNDQNPNDAISCKDVVPGTACGPALGKTLIQLFGALPEGFKAKPAVYTQCPEPGARPGTCTMHASRVDLAPVLAALGYIGSPPSGNVFVPTPNHSHVLDDSDVNLDAEWWQVLPVLVLNKSDWPPQDGSSGITSVAALNASIQAGNSIKAPSNFFLYFRSHKLQSTMGGMKMGSSH